MASRKSVNLSASPTAPASPGSEGNAELVFELCSFAPMADADPSQAFIDASTVEEIIDYIVSARQRGSESLIGFRWQAEQVHDLSEQLDAGLLERDESRVGRFEYDYESQTVYIDIMGESRVHQHVQSELARYLDLRLAKERFATDDPQVHGLMQSVKNHGTISIQYGNQLFKQSDICFGQTAAVPSLVCEVS
jgi:hypothetical protein